jgi:predicted DNA binding CopG/RHH family protein
MNKYKLDKYERETLEAVEKAIESGNFKPVKNLKKEIAKYQKIAQFTLNKSRHINVRISERDLFKIKARAFERGMPYQTLVSSLLHQFSNGQIKELAR